MKQGGSPKLRSDSSGPTPFLCGAHVKRERESLNTILIIDECSVCEQAICSLDREHPKNSVC